VWRPPRPDPHWLATEHVAQIHPKASLGQLQSAQNPNFVLVAILASQEAESYELPRLAERGRRKSKDLKEQAMKFLEEALEPVFKLMDTSGDGQLDQKELKRAFDLVGRPTSDEAIERAIKELDTNNDGLVNLQEFKAIAWATAVDSAPETGAAAA